MKIGVFGGSFNPPHLMHLSIAEQLIHNHDVDKIIFVPTGMKYEYKNNLIENEHRLAMLKLLIKDHKEMDICSYELKEEVVHTYETLDYLKKEYPNDEIYFILGTDLLSYIDKWAQAKYLIENNKFLIIKRDTNPIEPILEKLKEYKDHFMETNVIPDGLSSSYIREQIQKGNIRDLKGNIPEEIIHYIEENHLYKES